MGEICPPAYSGGTGHSVNACGGETLSDYEKYFKIILIIQNKRIPLQSQFRESDSEAGLNGKIR